MALRHARRASQPTWLLLVLGHVVRSAQIGLLPSRVPTARYSLDGGAWQIVWRGGLVPSLEVRCRALGNATVLSTSGGFVSASAVSAVAANPTFGCLQYTEVPAEHTTSQTVDSVVLHGAVSGSRVLAVSGVVSSSGPPEERNAEGGARQRCRYNLTLWEGGGPSLDSAETARGAGGGGDAAEPPLRFELRLGPCAAPGPLYTEVTLAYASAPDEAVWGFGEQQSSLNMKGRRLPIITSEHGFGHGEQPETAVVNAFLKGCGGTPWTSYISVPHYLSSRNYSLHLLNSEPAVFDFTVANLTRVTLNGTFIEGVLLASPTPLGLLSAYTAVASGRMTALPPWSQRGAIVHVQGGTAVLRRRFQRLKEHNISISGLWVEDWTGLGETLHSDHVSVNWVLNTSYYNDWDALRDEVAAYGGARLLAYVSPFMIHYENLSPGNDLFSEAKLKGLLMRWCNGSVYLQSAVSSNQAAMLDLSNPAAVEWFESRVLQREVIQKGFSGWMADYGEWSPLDPDVCLHGDVNNIKYHSKYADVWVTLHRQKDADILPFVRTGSLRSPGAVRLFWTGDQLTNFDQLNGLPSALTAMLTSGLSGFALTHSDIGGFAGVDLFGLRLPWLTRRKATLLRWMELACFTALFRTHLGNAAKQNVQVDTDEDTLAHFGRFSELFAHLATYRRQVVYQEVSMKGWPLIRPLLLHYPQDSQTHDLFDQFMLGGDLLIAPVLHSEEFAKRAHVFGPVIYRYAVRSVYLPAGDWIRAWHEESTYTSLGQRFQLEVPYGQPAVFWRSSWLGGDDLAAFLRILDARFPGYTGGSAQPDPERAIIAI